MTSRVVVAFCIFLPFAGFAQSLTEQFRRASALQFRDRDSSNTLCRQLLRQAEATGHDSMTVVALMLLANNADFAGVNDSAIYYYRQALSRNTDFKYNTRLTIESAAKLSQIYLVLGQPDSARLYAELFDKLTDKYQPQHNGWPMLLYGELYRTLGRESIADDYYIKAIRRAEENNDSLCLSIGLFYYLSYHIDQLSTPEFLPYFEEYLDLTSRVREDRTVEYVHAHMIFGNTATEGQIRILNDAVDIALTEGRNPLSYQLMLTDILIEQERWDEALKEAQFGLQITYQRKDVGYILDFEQRLATIYEAIGDLRGAYPHLREYYSIKDSLEDVEMSKNLDALNIQYETAKKENEILAQAREIQRKTNEKNLLIVIMTGSLLIGGFLVFLFWNRSRLTAQIASQERLIQEHRIGQLESEKKIIAMSAMVEGQEAERMRIARDLHDGLGGLLATVKSHYSTLNTPGSANQAGSVDRMGELLDRASAEVRRISHNMAPQALRMGSLRDALSDVALQARAAGLEVDFEWHGSTERMDENTEIMLYRVGQELVYNVIKHAEANTLLVQVNRYAHELNLLVEDDGLGFDSGQVSGSGGLGLRSLEARVEYLNGSLDIDSKPNEGTTISIQVPI